MDIPSRLLYYFYMKPSKAFERIQDRSLTDSKMTLNYMEKLHKHYISELLNLLNILGVINANKYQEDIEHKVIQAIAINTLLHCWAVFTIYYYCCHCLFQSSNTLQGSKLAVVRWSGTTKKSNGPAKYKFQCSAGPVTFNFSFFLFCLITIRHA